MERVSHGGVEVYALIWDIIQTSSSSVSPKAKVHCTAFETLSSKNDGGNSSLTAQQLGIRDV